MTSTRTTGGCIVLPVRWPDVLNPDGVDQASLAVRYGYSQQAVSAWMRLRSFPDADTLARLATVLGVDESELVVAIHEAKRRPKPEGRAVPGPRIAALEERMAVLERRFDELVAELRSLPGDQDTSARGSGHV